MYSVNKVPAKASLIIEWGFMMNIGRLPPPALAMASFIAGVAVHSFFPLTTVPVQIWWILAAALALSFAFYLYDRSFAVCCLIFVVFIFGLWRFDVAVPTKIALQDVSEHVGTVKDVQDGIYGLQAKVAIDGGPIVQFNLKQTIAVGSMVGFSCALKPLEQKDGELDRRYAANLHRAQAKCTVKDLTVIKPPAWWDVRQIFADLRDWTTARITAAMPGDEGALIAGMLYGERGMSAEAQDRFRRAGLTHLIAVSGSNITIVASVVFALLMGIGLWRRQAFWATSIALLAYVTFAGFSASVARAAAMGWLVLFARHTGRLHKTWYVLLVSAAVLNMIDPWMLGYDAGFALSFLATMGLMVWSPIFSERLSFLPEVGGVREAASTTFGATLMTLPYMAFAFERASLAGLLTNVVAVPLVPYAMLFGAVAAAWGNLPGWTIVSLPAMGVAKTIFAAAKIADLLPWLDIHMERMDLALCLATYGLIAYIWFALRRKKAFSTGK